MSLIIIYILISIALSAFFSGMEIAYVSSNKLRLELDKKQGLFYSRIINIFTANPSRYIATMLVGNNIALVIFGLLMAILLEPLIIPYTRSNIAILTFQTIISTLIILLTAEFLPKALFRINPNGALKLFAVPVLVFYLILYPVTRLTIIISDFILKYIAGVPVQSKNVNTFGKVDLDHLVTEGQVENGEEQQDKTEIRLFQNVLDFSEVKVRDCMVPRPEVVAFDETASMEEIRQKFIETGLSKILIYKENIDNVLGYVNSKGLFSQPKSIKEIIMTLPIVPETMPAHSLFKQLGDEHKSIAVVVDEFGGTGGIVTIEDILEEIFGEIEDEHDTSEFVEKKINDREFIFSGRLEIDYINNKYQLDFPKSDDYETLAGFILYHYESFPNINESIIIDNYSFKILDASETKIELVHLVCLEE